MSATHSCTTYWLAVIAHPSSWLTLMAGLSLAIAVSSFMLAAAVMATVLIGAGIAGRQSDVRRAIDARRRTNSRTKRRCQRESRLEQANVDRTELANLTGLVAEIDRNSPIDVDRFELDALLDRYAEVAIAHARCRDTLRSIDRTEITAALEIELARERREGGVSHHRSLLERQLSWWDRYKTHAEQLHDEMVTIGELLKVFAIRAAEPPVWADQLEVDDRLVQLDDEDSARRLLENA